MEILKRRNKGGNRMNINHHQTKGDRSYFEWGDNMQIIRKGKGEIAMTDRGDASQLYCD